MFLSTFEGIFVTQIDSEGQKFFWQKSERTTSDTLHSAARSLVQILVKVCYTKRYTLKSAKNMKNYQNQPISKEFSENTSNALNAEA